MTSKHAVVVGGGIAGLATAAALQRGSWQVTLVERQSALSEVGAGITLWPNALRALDALGLGGRIRERGLAQSSGGIRDSRGRWLSRTDTAALVARYGDGVVVVERAELLDALQEACGEVDIRTSTEVTAADGEGTVTIASSGSDGNCAGEVLRGDVVIGADGVWSAVRAALWPHATVRSTDTLAARLVGRLVGSSEVAGGEIWNGGGDYAGVAPLPDGRLYAYLAVPVAAEPNGEVDWWQQRFAEWPFPLPQVLADAESSQLLLNELYELTPLDTLVRGRIALVGDAAHAMTPNLGQGACQALEDAVELSAVLDHRLAEGDITQRLSLYNRRRLPRVHRIAKWSHSAGVAASLAGRAPTTFRNTVIGLLPAGLLLRRLDTVIDWHAPGT